MEIPKVVLVGRPNVGKSTLFNWLIGQRYALEHDAPGVTRDWLARLLPDYGVELLDTGGFDFQGEALSRAVFIHSEEAIRASQHICWVVDGSIEPTLVDEAWADWLRRTGVPITILLNHSDKARDRDTLQAQWLVLGWPVIWTSAAHRRGFPELQALLAQEGRMESVVEAVSSLPRVVVMGQPNVGKSTLYNALLGRERVTVFNEPGTTRDVIAERVETEDFSFELLDTPGIARRIPDVVERFSTQHAWDLLTKVDVGLLLLDGSRLPSTQDVALFSKMCERIGVVILVCNKADLVANDYREEFMNAWSLQARFVGQWPVVWISAKTGKGIKGLLKRVQLGIERLHQPLSNAELTEMLLSAQAAHPPVMVKGRRVKLRYAHVVSRYPLKILVHGKQTEALPADYLRYLTNTFRAHFQLEGMGIQWECRSDHNPFAGQVNTLTPRQERSKKRLMRYVKRKK